jgi:adenylate kinase family enzyme
MNPIRVIHIFGASGSGATTLARAVGARYGYRFIDVDDAMWEPTDPPFTVRRPDAECRRRIEAELALSPRSVVSGAFVGWGDVFIPKLDLVVFMHLPEDVRVERINRRERARFGDRVAPGGDLYAQHLDFVAWARSYDTEDVSRRSRAQHERWLGRLSCPVIRIERPLPLEELLELVGKHLA